jgi:hypothetical protein
VSRIGVAGQGRHGLAMNRTIRHEIDRLSSQVVQLQLQLSLALLELKRRPLRQPQAANENAAR